MEIADPMVEIGYFPMQVVVESVAYSQHAIETLVGKQVPQKMETYGMAAVASSILATLVQVPL